MVIVKEVSVLGLRAAANAISKGGRLPLQAMFANDERPINGNFCIYVFFAAETAGEFQLVKCNIAAGQPLEFPSLTTLLPAAAWYEREIHDLFGLVPVGHPDLRPLVLHDPWPEECFPMRKDFTQAPAGAPLLKKKNQAHVHGEGVFEVPVGPIHAGIIEPGYFRFSQAGENVIQLDPTLFYTHRGIEKSLEGLPVDRAIFRIERTCGACSVSHALSFSQALESLSSKSVPDRALYIRVLVAELERLYNHIGDVGNICAGVGFAVGASQAGRQKELLMRFNEELTGNRFLRGMVVPGGVAYDLSGELIRYASSLINAMTPDFKELIEILEANAGFIDRCRQTGILPRQVAADLAVVGPAARASGIDVDLRRDHSYAAYDRVNFKVPVRRHGDVEDRLWLRVAEVKESCGIIRQAIDFLANQRGELRVELEIAKTAASGLGWSESARGANFHWLMLDANRKIYRYVIRSASYPNWPAVSMATPGNIIPDFPLINKSFELCYACLDR
jgi:Ni,Fe-hydrogenase III large subunit/Ni,Fe-hydrogenase III component G